MGNKQSRAASSVVVIHEDGVTREEAVRFCDRLVKRFWAITEFEIRWWSLQHLEHPDTSSQAAEQAAAADLIVFGIQPGLKMPEQLFAWMEEWINRRGEREGALVGLLDPAAQGTGCSTDVYCYLRQAAHRAGMDYLIHLPNDLPHSIPDSLDYCSERAGQMTSVLDGILHRPAPLPTQIIRKSAL